MGWRKTNDLQMLNAQKQNIKAVVVCKTAATQLKYFKNMTKAILLSKDAGRMPSELAYMLENT